MGESTLRTLKNQRRHWSLDRGFQNRNRRTTVSRLLGLYGTIYSSLNIRARRGDIDLGSQPAAVLAMCKLSIQSGCSELSWSLTSVGTKRSTGGQTANTPRLSRIWSKSPTDWASSSSASGSNPNSLVIVVMIFTSASEDQVAIVSRVSESFSDPRGTSSISSITLLKAECVIMMAILCSHAARFWTTMATAILPHHFRGDLA